MLFVIPTNIYSVIGRLDMILSLFPKSRRGEGRDGGDVAGAEKGEVAVTHFKLVSGEVAEMCGVVAGESVAQNIGYPMGKTCRAA